MEPWYKVVTPRKEVREGRSCNPDEFAIHLEGIVAKTASDDRCNPVQFFPPDVLDTDDERTILGESR